MKSHSITIPFLLVICILSQVSPIRAASLATDSVPSLTKADLDSIRQQAIVDSLMSKNLDEVTVEAQSNYSTVSGMTYLPTKKQKNIAQDMAGLLRVMAIPQLRIDPRTDAVTDNAGEAVQLFINYLPATAEDQKGLRPDDVKKVEFLIAPADPRFRGAKKVLNFIVQEYEYGGYTRLTTSNSGFHAVSSGNVIFSKFTYKKMTYDLFANFRYNQDTHMGYSENNTYTLLDSEGKPYEYHRAQSLEKCAATEKYIPITFRATYSSDKVQMRNTLGYYNLSVPEFYSQGNLYISSDPNGNNTYMRSKPQRANNISYVGDYYFMFPKGFSLDVAPSFYYSYNHKYYDYQSSLETPNKYDTKENAYNYTIDATLSKKFNDRHSIGLILVHSGNLNDVKYMTGNSSGPQHFRNYTSNVSLHYKYTGEKWFVSNYVGVSSMVNKNNSDKISEVSPTFDLYANYNFNSNNSAYVNVKYERMNPSQSYKTDELLQQNEIIFTRGNPYLKNYNWMKASIGYNWNPSNKFRLGVFGNFAANFDRVIRTFEHYRDGSALLRSYMNSGNFYNSNVGVSFTLNLLNHSLTLQCSPTLSFYKSTGLYSASYNPFGLFSYATYYLKQFYFQAYYQPDERSLESLTAGRDETRTNYGLTAGMSRSGWNVSLTCQNIFNKGFRSFSSEDSMPLAKINSQSYMSYYGPRFEIRVTYTFGYGKKVQRGDEVGQQRVAGSAIMN